MVDAGLIPQWFAVRTIGEQSLAVLLISADLEEFLEMFRRHEEAEERLFSQAIAEVTI